VAVKKLLVSALFAGVLALAVLGIVTVATGGVPDRSGNGAANATPAAPDGSPGKTDYPAPRPRVAVAVGPGEDPPPGAQLGDGESTGGGAGSAASSRRASDDEIRAELAAFKRAMRRHGGGVSGPRAQILPSGEAVAPRNAPAAVKMMIAAGNEIARDPYKWGGGHGAWQDDGYDCSGSVSFALAGAGLLQAPLNSTGFMSWGEQGEGEWVSIYANHGHVFMVVAGLRFDTSGRGSSGSRWQTAMRPTDSFVAVHPAGL
jgi:cell wall-associated NlpC family hydrolase